MAISNLILFDDPQVRINLLPFTFTRPVCDIRVGIRTIRQKWEHFTGLTSSTLTKHPLADEFPPVFSHDNLLINGCICPSGELMAAIEALELGQGLFQGQLVLAARVEGESAALDSHESLVKALKPVAFNAPVLSIQRPWEIFSKNDEALRWDYQQLTEGAEATITGEHNTLISPQNIYIHPTAKVTGATINASAGPVYIGHDAEVMEGCLIRGPFALCDHSTLKMGAKIYGATTIGPHCKVGGEVNNSVIFGFSNKAHDGFLGNSVIGEWCNLGADSNNSNLKNNYGTVKIWNYGTSTYEDTGLQFCGLLMADHAKCGINTMFNTGTVVGVFANVFGGDFPPKYIASFSWGGAAGFSTYHLKKAYEVAERVMERRGLALSVNNKTILSHIFEETAVNRKNNRA